MKQVTAALRLRKAAREDGPFLLAMRNADDVRSQSKTQDVISEETHRDWLQRHLNSSGTVIWIIEREGERLGYIRAQKIDGQRTKGQWFLSIALQHSTRGKGCASWALGEACRLLNETCGARRLVAEVLAENSPARRFFKRLGFVEKEILRQGELDLVRFELDTGESHRLSIHRG